MVKVKQVTKKVAKTSVAAVKNEINKVKKTAKLGKAKKTEKETTRKVKQQLAKKQKRETELNKLCKNRGVVYLKHIPHGFYEKEMYDYFKQFGTVTAIKLPRSKDGKAKGFAFIEFEYKEIAKVVADTMNNYIMFEKLLKTEYIPPEKQKPHLFHRASMPWDDTTNKDAADKRRLMDRLNKNKPILDPAAFAKKTQQAVEKVHSTLLKKTGFDYEFQVNDPESEKVQLISVKRKSADVTPSKSKLKTVKNKTDVKTIKKVKTLKNKVKNLKNKAKKVIKNSAHNKNINIKKRVR